LCEHLVSNARRLGLTDADNPVCGIDQELLHNRSVLSRKILMNEDDVHSPPKVYKKWECSIGNILIPIITKMGTMISREKSSWELFILLLLYFGLTTRIVSHEEG